MKEYLGDVVTAGALIAYTLPLLAIVALAIKYDSPGPVFYRQERIRLRGGRFIALKFRTTVHCSERGEGPIRRAHRDACLTRVGRLLRFTRIDNLPQLVNVIRGEMSAIGAGPGCPYFLH
jgi:lipopolysaccharide/colanic/teichoic acid biosynthesis glycosyltransferase